MSPSTLIDGYRLISGYLSPDETAHGRQQVEEHRDRFQAVTAKAGMNLPYSVLDGHQIREHLPELFELATTRLWTTTQEIVGRPLEPMRDPKRAVRIQHYSGNDQGFRWHVDGGHYSAILTLVNTTAGGTELIPPRLSRYLKPVPYVLFPFPRVLTLARPILVLADAGDLMVIHGGATIHRGINPVEPGERMVLVATFDPVGRKNNPIWTWAARRLNY